MALVALFSRGRVLCWVSAPALGLGYLITTLKAADNPKVKINIKDLEIYDNDVEHSSNETNDESPASPLQEQISKGRKFVWKHWNTVKNVTDTTADGGQHLWTKVKEVTNSIQTDGTTQLKTGIIVAGTLTGVLIAGRGRRPLRRVFFASTMGMATAAACYPQQAIEKANLSYGKVLSFFTDWKSNSDSEQIHKHVNLSGLPDNVDDEQKPNEKSPEKMKETDLVGIKDSDNFIPGYEYIASAIIDELSNAVKGWGVAVEELENMANVILKEIMAGINEDINIQTGGWVGQEHKPHVVLDGKDLVRRIANEVLEAIEADMNVQTGGRLEQTRELCLESKHLAKSIVDSIMKEVEYDIKQGESDAPYLFSLRDELRKLAIKMFENEIYQASMGIGRNVKRIHVNVDMLSETVGRQLKERIEELYIRSNCAGEFDDREVAIINFQEIRKSVTGGLGKYLSDHSLVTPHTKENSVHVVKDWGELTKRVVNAMTRAFQNDIETETRRLETTKKPSIVIDARNLALSVVEEITEAIQEDIDIQTGKGFRSEEANVRDEKPVGGDPGQSEPEDKVMYSTRSQ